MAISHPGQRSCCPRPKHFSPSLTGKSGLESGLPGVGMPLATAETVALLYQSVLPRHDPLLGAALLYRFVLTTAAVAMLSYCLAHFESARGQRHMVGGPAEASWVRTSDGWAHGESLWPAQRPSVRPTLHPLLVAGFQLSASLFVLVAFPSSAGRNE